MQDLLGLEMDYTRDLPPDAPSRSGFTNDAQAMQMSPMQLETYLDNARRALDRVIVIGETPNHGTMSSPKRRSILGSATHNARMT